MRKPLNVMKIRTLQSGDYNPVSNSYGMVRNNHTQAHQGWDLTAAPGTPVYAIADGEVTVGHSATYGNWVSLKFSYKCKPHYAFYAHLQTAYQGNSSVREGALLGFTGRSGNAAGIPQGESHLHFEIRTMEHPPLGLTGRMDPGQVLGYELYQSYP